MWSGQWFSLYFGKIKKGRKKNLSKDKAGAITDHEIKLCWIATVIKIVWQWEREGHRSTEEKEVPRRPTHLSSNEFLQRCKGSSDLSTNSSGQLHICRSK